MWKRTILVALCLVILFAAIIAIVLSACSSLDGTEKQQCLDAMEKLADQSQVHLISTTLVGEEPDHLEESAVSEYWISGQDWASCRTTSGSDALWQIVVTGETFGAMEISDQRMWQTTTANTQGPPSWIPPVDLGSYNVVSEKKKDDSYIITLTADIAETTPGSYGNVAYSDYQVVFSLDINGTIRRFEQSFCTSLPQKDGSISNVYWKQVMEYPDFSDGEIVAFLQSLYQEAVAENLD